jgi:hypothetical protein
MHGGEQTPGRQVGFNRAPIRIVRRVPRVFGFYAPYYAPPVEEQPAAAPVIVESETPVYVNVGLPSQQLVAQQLCTGPEIIELGKPKKPNHPLPRVIYAAPSPCAAQSVARRGPGVYDLE